MAKIYLIRHCESEGNACRRTQAHVESIITKKGYQQNEALRRRFKGIHVDAVYSSDSYRSVMTVKPIADDRNLKVRLKLKLREVTTGVWEDMCWGNIIRLYPEEHRVWQSEPWHMITPGGSTFQQVSAMCLQGLREIAKDVGPDGVAVACSHSCTIKATLCMIMNLPMDQVLTFGHGDNTSVSLLNVDEDGNISVEFMNDASHLTEGLARSWAGMAGTSVNMGTDPVENEEDIEELAQFMKAGASEKGISWNETECKARIRSILTDHPKYFAFGHFDGKHVGYVEVAQGEDLPKDTGVLAETYIVPEYRGRGFAVQLFGYAAWVMRCEYKERILIPIPQTEEEKEVADRFLFAPMEGHPDYLTLDLYPPALVGYHMLA